MSMTGDRLESYTRPRADLLDLLPSLPEDLPVLDVGCSNGANGRQLRTTRHVRVVGIERDPTLAAQARSDLIEVFEGDAIEQLEALVEAQFEASAVIFADVLEHLADPWRCVDLAQRVMPRGGWILTSIPNVAHLDTLVNLLRGTWPMRSRGIHDDEHLRFFGRRDLPLLLERQRGSIVQVRRIYRLIERPHPVNRWARLVGWMWPNVFTFQFHVLVQVAPEGTE